MFTSTRFRSIPSPFVKNQFDDFVNVNPPTGGERIVDDSYFVPNHEAVKIAQRQQAGQILDSLLYDSPSDIARGAVNVYARQRGRDIAELTQQNRQLQAEAEKLLKTELKAQAQAKTSQQAKAVAQNDSIAHE